MLLCKTEGHIWILYTVLCRLWNVLPPSRDQVGLCVRKRKSHSASKPGSFWSQEQTRSNEKGVMCGWQKFVPIQHKRKGKCHILQLKMIRQHSSWKCDRQVQMMNGALSSVCFPQVNSKTEVSERVGFKEQFHKFSINIWKDIQSHWTKMKSDPTKISHLSPMKLAKW